MGVNPVLSIFFAICILALFLPTASAADNCNEKFDKNQKLTYDEVQEVIECELKNTERIEKLVRELLKKIDFEKEFKNITGVTITTAIVLFILATMLPDLLIILIVYLCCLFCKCAFCNRAKPKKDNPEGPASTKPTYDTTDTSQPYGATAPESQSSYSQSPSTQDVRS